MLFAGNFTLLVGVDTLYFLIITVVGEGQRQTGIGIESGHGVDQRKLSELGGN